MVMDTIAVVGTGHMGRGIAQVLLAGGKTVLLLGRSESRAGDAAGAVLKAMATALRRKVFTAEQVEGAVDRLSPLALGGAAAELAKADLLIEAVTEDRRVKAEVLAATCPSLGDEAVVATNTSSLSVAALAQAGGRPERFAGLHFMNPAEQVKLVEVVTHDGLGEGVAEALSALCKELGKQPIVVADSPGFVVNRLLMPMIVEAARLVEAGLASARDVDTAMRLGCAHPMGPLSLADSIGLDVILAEMRELSVSLGERYAPPAILDQLVESGKLGRKSGEGFLRYGRSRPTSGG